VAVVVPRTTLQPETTGTCFSFCNIVDQKLFFVKLIICNSGVTYNGSRT